MNELKMKELMKETKEVLWASITSAMSIDDLLSLETDEAQMIKKALKLIDKSEDLSVSMARDFDQLLGKIDHLEEMVEKLSNK